MLDRLNRCLVDVGNLDSLVTILPRPGFTAAVPRVRSPSIGKAVADGYLLTRGYRRRLAAA
jgi:hypothetical protein